MKYVPFHAEKPYPTQDMRTRFPPSPTGMLHVGGLRTALFCYLIAKKAEDAFILRIEDTDQEREVDGAVQNILETLMWAGLEPNEGVVLEHGEVAQIGNNGPYIQSQRLELYKEYAQKLLDSGHAYYAFDTKAEIDRMREEGQKAGNPAPKYDLSVRMRMKNSLSMSEEEVQQKISAGEPYVIRLKVPENHIFVTNDEVRGRVEFKSSAVDDAVLLKSDGFPTYHLANVVDDHLMKIDIVIRGEEWLPSLPKHLLLYEAFGWETPKFAHVPLLLNQGGGKLSKRQGDVAASDYMEKGYLPEAMVNFLVLLGWNPGSTKEIFSLKELVEEFSLERVQKGGAVFDTEKLDWLQGQWIRSLPLTEFAERILPGVTEKYSAAAKDGDFEAKAELIQERITFFHEAPEMLSYFYQEPAQDKELLASAKQKVTPEALPDILSVLLQTLEPIQENNWNGDFLKDTLFAVAEEKDMKRGQILWPLRAALTGLPFSPGAFEVAEALGKEVTIKRLSQAQESL
jgi:glutamyl-tRNA synthetase